MLQTKLGQFNADLPLDQACTIPADWYTDAEIAVAERRSVFGDTWQLVGRIDQVREPGSFFTADVAGEPIVVVRSEDGVLRGFYNVCRHRAARVALEAEGKASRFRCRYHGWTYDLSGRLRGVPEFEGVANFSRDENGLVPVHVECWGPLVFAHLGQNPPALADYLRPWPEKVAGLGIEALRFVERRVYELACNWKVFVDNYLDGGYHVNTIHPGLSGVLNYAGYHTVNDGYTSVQISPMRTESVAEFAGIRAPAAPNSGEGPNSGEFGYSGASEAGVGEVRKGTTAYYWWIFPNLMLNLYEGIMDTNLVLPFGPDRCRVLFDFYFTQTEGEEARQFMNQSMAVGHQIQQEDVDICEDVQRGLNSRAFQTGRYSVRRESGVYHFHKLLAQGLNHGLHGLH